MGSLQKTRLGVLHLLVADLNGSFQIGHLFFTSMRSLDDYLNSIDQVAIGDGRRCHRLVWFLRLSAFYPTRAITF
jgi:hypothetical protein